MAKRGIFVSVSITKKEAYIALIGNPNVGKTTLFNALTGLQQKTGNFAGVTVEKKFGKFTVEDKGSKYHCQILDLPGTYSLSASAPDEMIAIDSLMGRWQEGRPDLILAIVDASNLERNLYLISQLLECHLPLILALNMYDLAQKKGIEIHLETLAQTLHCPVVPVVANKRKGLEKLRNTIVQTLQSPSSPPYSIRFPENIENALSELDEYLQQNLNCKLSRAEIVRLLIDPDSYLKQRLEQQLDEDFQKFWENLLPKYQIQPEELLTLEPELRYQWAQNLISQCTQIHPQTHPPLSEKVDKILTHPFWGLGVFLIVMGLVFQSIFQWATPLMDWLDAQISLLSSWISTLLPSGPLQSLIVDGVIAGIGSVIVFLPQIVILFMFISILEDCGYMARAAFLMDKLMSWAGISGHSFVPMLSSFACAVPGIMATRTIENRRDRFTTILIAPLMSCSARLPVYVIMIATFIPPIYLWNGWISLQSLTLFAMYLLGICVALPVAWVLKKTLLKGKTPPFIMEMPSYKIPDYRTVGMQMYKSAKSFLLRAGSIILAMSVLIWACTYFPRSSQIDQLYHQKQIQLKQKFHTQRKQLLKHHFPHLSLQQIQTNPTFTNLYQQLPQPLPPKNSTTYQTLLNQHGPTFSLAYEFKQLENKYNQKIKELENQKNAAHLKNSFLGRAGQFLAPAFQPLGWDWKITMATLASFPAREVIISTLGIIYQLGADVDEGSQNLRQAMQNDRYPNGKPVFSALVALSIMVFFALCCQCMATLAIITKETGSFYWAALAFVYMTTLAYLAALVVYQGGTLWGF
ncbi:MAG: ferrous iron transport protein B [Planctomycetota bacterium]|nr:MAG: ferrous iron transport protein B [Planctomycetota bacterium]